MIFETEINFRKSICFEIEKIKYLRLLKYSSIQFIQISLVLALDKTASKTFVFDSKANLGEG